MLLIKHKLQPSTIHGLGVFAEHAIPAGTEMWRFTPGFDLEKTAEELAQLPVHLQDWYKHFGYLDFHHGKYILSCDDARFINHSDDPNMVPNYDKHAYGIGVAGRDIAAGEEITIDYSHIETENFLSRAKQ
jgi:SET domain-containing protein